MKPHGKTTPSAAPVKRPVNRSTIRGTWTRYDAIDHVHTTSGAGTEAPQV